MSKQTDAARFVTFVRRHPFILTIAVVIVVSPAIASDTATIEAQPSGTLVTLDSNPVVTVIGSQPTTLDGYTYSNYAVFAQDSTGGVDLFGHLPGSYVPAVGDTVMAAGTFSPFDMIPEVATLTSLTNTGTAAVPSPLAVTPAALQTLPTYSNYLGYYLSMQNVYITQQNVSNPVPGSFPVHANGTYTITDSGGLNPVTMFFWASSYSMTGAMGGTVIPTGLVNLTGIVDVFGSGPTAMTEFAPFTITPVPEPSSLGLLFLGGLVLVRRCHRNWETSPNPNPLDGATG